MEPTDGSTVVEDRPGIDREIQPGESDGGGGSDIRCPICRWTPGPEDRWMCSCSHLWNTFDTGGVCPACLLKWAYTCCPACQVWSPHSDWYRDQSS